MTEAISETKDNVKYLTTLEKSFEPLYNGTPATILENVPAMMNNIKMLQCQGTQTAEPCWLQLHYAHHN